MQEHQLADLQYAVLVGMALSKPTKISEISPTTMVAILALSNDIKGCKLNETLNLIMGGLVINVLSQKNELNGYNA